jgi:hypothetical protein
LREILRFRKIVWWTTQVRFDCSSLKVSRSARVACPRLQVFRVQSLDWYFRQRQSKD